MKSVRILMMAATAAVLAAPYVSADGVVMKVRVPFDFVVAGQHFPGGEYKLVQQQDPMLVRLCSMNNENLAIAHWVALPSSPAGRATLVLHRYGSQRFLKEIRASNGSGAYLPKTRAEEEAQAGGGSAAAGTS